MAKNYRSPGYVVSAHEALQSGVGVEEALAVVVQRHDRLLRHLHTTLKNYDAALNKYGPYHEVELGEPVARFAEVYRLGIEENE